MRREYAKPVGDSTLEALGIMPVSTMAERVIAAFNECFTPNPAPPPETKKEA